MSGRSLIYQNGDDDPSSSDKVEVIISPSSSSSLDRISAQTQQQEPTVPREEEMSSLKENLRRYASEGSWLKAKSILDRCPELVRTPLTVNNRDTALHIAVKQSHTDFVRGFVNYENVTTNDLEIKDANGNTAFCLAAMKGNREFLKIMIRKNKNLPLKHGIREMLPVHLTLLYGFKEIVQDISSENLLKEMAVKDIQQLFFMAIYNNLYGVVKNILYIDKVNWANVRDDEEKTALHIMALKPIDAISEYNLEFMVSYLWRIGGKNVEYEERMKLITTPSILLFDAIKSENFGFIKAIYYYGKPKPWELKDPATGQTMLHTAVLFRQSSIIDFLFVLGLKIVCEEEVDYELDLRLDLIKNEIVDKDGNNALHYAARQIQEVSASLRLDLQIKREVTWFEKMEKKFGPEFSKMTNKDGKTPKDMFHVHHRKLSDDAKDTIKGVANTCMVVAALIVAVAFAAALTTPGDKSSVWFTVFIMANGAALFTSALSIVAFLTIFTSPTFKESDFVTSLYPSLTVGKVLLFISLMSMIIAFGAASFLIFGHEHKWVAYAVSSLGLLTIIYILQLQLSLFGRLLDCFSTRNIKLCLKSIKGMFGFQMESGSVSSKEA